MGSARTSQASDHDTSLGQEPPSTATSEVMTGGGAGGWGAEGGEGGSEGRGGSEGGKGGKGGSNGGE